MMLGIIAFVREHGPDPGHDREGSQEQALEDQRVIDIGAGTRLVDVVAADVDELEAGALDRIVVALSLG